MEPAIRKTGRENANQRNQPIKKRKRRNIEVESQSSISTVPIATTDSTTLGSDSIPLDPSSDLLRILHFAAVDVVARGNEIDATTARQLDGAFSASALSAIAKLMIEYASHLLKPTLDHLQEAVDMDQDNSGATIEMNDNNNTTVNSHR